MSQDNKRMKELLKNYLTHIRSDEALIDEYLGEGMTFTETLELMDHIANAVESYILKRGDK